MRHKVYGKKLNRDIKERKALFRSLINAMILHGKITTTYAKAKAIGGLIEKLVTKAKDGSRSSLNQIASFLNRKEPVKKLVEEITPRFKDRVGGYIRMIRLGRRHGDNAQKVLMEWTAPEKEEKEIQKKEKETIEKTRKIEKSSQKESKPLKNK